MDRNRIFSEIEFFLQNSTIFSLLYFNSVFFNSGVSCPFKSELRNIVSSKFLIILKKYSLCGVFFINHINHLSFFGKHKNICFFLQINIMYLLDINIEQAGIGIS